MNDDKAVQEKRQQITEIDQQLALLCRQRINLAEEIFNLKKNHKSSIVDFAQERKVLSRFMQVLESDTTLVRIQNFVNALISLSKVYPHLSKEMNMTKKQEFSVHLKKMWADYCQLNPQAKAVYDALTETGEDIVNDHIAFRTFSDARVNVEVLSRYLLNYGYKQVGAYEFTEKKLKAKHFEHIDICLPKVFISEFDLKQGSTFLQEVVKNSIDHIDLNQMKDLSFLYSGRPWLASHQIYKKILQESEYAAWVYAHGFRPNHFTVYVNYLKKLNRMEDLNSFLTGKGFVLNTSGEAIKGSPSVFLEQSSTMANVIPASFQEGVFDIPACYYEFAKRYPTNTGELFQGFVAESANKIFESTGQIKN